MRRNVLVVLIAFTCLGAWAQQAPELNEIVVTATRIDSPILESPSFVTVITPADIQQSGAVDPSAVLSQQSGVVINDYGPLGAGKTVSIRGSTSSQVLVLVDGIRLNSSFNGYVDISKISMGSVDHIEVVQGGAGTLWGTGAVGGVINIITKQPAETSIDLEITNGSYLPHDSTSVQTVSEATFPYTTSSISVPLSVATLFDNQKISLGLSGKLGSIGLSGGGSYVRAANAFVWNDTSGLNDWRQRNNAQDDALSAYVGLQVPLFGGTLSTRGSLDHSVIGVPGSLSSPTSQSGQEDTAATGSFGFTTDQFIAESLSLDVKGSYRFWQETLKDPQAAAPAPTQSLHTMNSGNLDLTQKLTVSEALSAVYGGSGSFERVDSTNIVGGRDRLSLAAFLSVPFSPIESLTITPSLRYDYYSDFPGYLSYQLGAVLLLSDRLSLKTSLGSAYRVPTFSDLYWTDSYGDVGNPNLKPETSYNGEIGLSFADERVSLESSLFARLTYDQINWNFNAFPVMPVNISESLLPGVEVHATVRLTDQISIEANYSFIYNLLLSYLGTSYSVTDNMRVPFVPLHDLSVIGRLQTGIHSLNLELEYVSEKETSTPDFPSSKLPGYALISAGYRIAATEHLVFSLTLRNILNTLYYTQVGYPMPPFSVVTGAQLHL